MGMTWHHPALAKRTINALDDDVARLRAALEKARIPHRYCDDSWYSCPKEESGCADESQGDKCNCGADEHNAAIDAALRHR
jgi:hypothetical protein